MDDARILSHFEEDCFEYGYVFFSGTQFVIMSTPVRMVLMPMSVVLAFR